MAISIPIRSETGGVAGVLSGGMLLKRHSLGGIEEIRIGKSGYAYIVESGGQVVAHPQRGHLLENFSLRPPVKELLAHHREGVIEFVNDEGIRVLAAYAPIREARLGVIVLQPASESYAHIQNMFDVLLFIFALSLGLAILVALSLAWRMGRPVRDLARGVRRVAEGDLDAVVPVQTRDEMGDLARDFNSMTGRLKKYVESAALAEHRLARSEKLAAVGQLAAGIAHEIYNPLNIIGGFAEFLSAKTPADDPRRSALEDIGRETDRCRRLVADLLGFARERPPQMKPTDLNALAAEAVELAGARARPGGVNVIFHPDGNLPLIETDQDQIMQVLMNLLLNACQALPNGGEVGVETRLDEDRAVLSVRDTGAGLSPENMAKIFTPFFTTKENGTGLGLALSYAVVERHGGELRAENDPRGGARFTMSLPIKGAVHV
jgi:two-component system NtrC family sensor kinase